MDGNYNPMPLGTTVAIDPIYTSINYTYSDATGIHATAASVNVSGSPVPDSNHAGGTLVSLVVSGGTGCYGDEAGGTLMSYPRGPVAIDVTSPQGYITTIPIYVTSPTLTLTASSHSVATSGTSTLTATFTDIYGKPVSGQTVYFAITANASGGSLDYTSKTTNSSGQASVTYTAGTTSGVFDVINTYTTYNGNFFTTPVSITVTP